MLEPALRTMHVACATDAGYFKHCAAMIASLLEFNPGAHVRVLCDANVSDDDRRSLERWASERGGIVECVTPRAELPKSLPGLARLTRAAWLRLLLPDMLPDLHRILYLDVDVIVRDTLKDLWRLDLQGRWIAAVTDISQRYYPIPNHTRMGFERCEDYFNSGVMLVDLDAFRANDVTRRAFAFAAEHASKIALADQDTLCGLLHTQRLPLHLRWNVLSPIYEGGATHEFPFSQAEVVEAKQRPAVIHFSGDWKPWHYRSKHPLRKLYASYRQQTPWPEWQLEGQTWKHRWLRMLSPSLQYKLRGLYWQARWSFGPGAGK